MAKCESKWMAQGKTFAWLSKEPQWVGGNVCWFWFENRLQQPCEKIYRFSLIGGGQLSVIEDWRLVRLVDEDGSWDGKTTAIDCESMTHWRRVVATPHVGDHVERHRGIIEGFSSDMSADAVVFGNNTPQDIADRAAATLAAIGDDEDTFYALLDSSEGCAFCRRPLRDEISKLVGVGPDCARKHGVPHSMAAASKRLEIRRRVLGETDQAKH